MSQADIPEAKATLRREMRARRDALAPQERQRAAAAVASRALPLVIAPGSVVSGFMPISSEINPLPLLRRLVAAGARLALPAVAGKALPLVMRAWSFDAALQAGTWDIREPLPTAPALDPDVVIVPLLAFDRRGHRLGYGAGYYDMTLTALRASKPIVAVGIGYALQEIERVPATPRDARLDLVLTERETIDLRAP